MLELLASVISTADARQVEQLWAAAERWGTPVVSPVVGDPDTYQVTYLCRASGADVTSVRINGAPVWHESDEVLRDPDGMAGATRMLPVPGTDVWWRSFQVPADLRSHYSFLESHRGDPAAPVAAPDPFNTNRWPDAPAADPPLPEWVEQAEGWPFVELPGAAPRLCGEAADIRRGEMVLHRVPSRILANDRRVWVWTPPAVADAAGDAPLPVLVVHDGWHWTLPGCSVAAMMDRLVSTGAVPRMVVVAQESPAGEREELACDPRFVDFLTDELLPWARGRWPVTTYPERTAIAGQSLGGLNAAYSAHRRPDVFGAVISQSGSFWWPHGTSFGRGAGSVLRLYAEEPRPAVRFSLDVGLLEGRMVGLSRHLRDVLVAGGHDVRYHEHLGGHSWLSWGPALPDALRAVTSGWTRSPETPGVVVDEPLRGPGSSDRTKPRQVLRP